MTIVSRDQVRAAVNRALQMDPRDDLGAAINVVAQAMGLSAEAVCEALEPSADEVLA